MIDAKIHGDSWLPIEWLWATWRRDLLRTTILNGIRTMVVPWFFSDAIDEADSDADSWAREQLDSVFGGEDNLIDATAMRVIPVVETA